MKLSMSRRGFLEGVAGVAVFAGHGAAFAQPAAQLRIRKSASELPPSDPVFAQYAQAVEAMHCLPQNDRRNWWRQAQIHADHCVHGGIDFLPWHRHYINQFERICGELIGDSSFALPYWDWSHGTGTIPDAFFEIMHLDVTFWDDPGVYSSPNWPGIDTIGIRAIGKGVGIQTDPIRGAAFRSQTLNSILGENTFSRFSGRLEGSPHNSGHVVVGFPAMGKPGHIGSGLSPLDPLFWLHHCNVDRLWAQWQLAGNTSASFAQTYNGQFVDRCGKPVDLRAADAIDFNALGYSYQQFPDPRRLLTLAGIVAPDAAAQPLLAAFRPENRIGETETVTIGTAEPEGPIEVGHPASIPVPVRDLQSQLARTRPALDANLPSLSIIETRGIDEKMLAQFGRPKATSRKILANLKGVAGDFERPPIVNVFLNCPYLSPETPNTDVHFADTFAFFGSHHGGVDHENGRSFTVELTRAVQNVDLKDTTELELQLMAVGPDLLKPAGTFAVDVIEIVSA